MAVNRGGMIIRQNFINSILVFLYLRGTIGDVFAVHAGYNGVAEVNNIIVLYPQVVKTLLTNPQGCWDWYICNDYFVTSLHCLFIGGATQGRITVSFIECVSFSCRKFVLPECRFQDRTTGVRSEDDAGQGGWSLSVNLMLYWAFS